MISNWMKTSLLAASAMAATLAPSLPLKNPGGFKSKKRENALAGENLGWRLETIVYLELRRRIKSEEEDIYYFNNGNTEADFIVCEGNRVIRIYQVAYDIENAKTRRREINGAIAAAQNTQCPNVYILTDHQSETIVHADITIKVLPVWEWIVRDDS